MRFADGGILDNLAVMPLLRRGVKCIIVLLASPLPPDRDAATYAYGRRQQHQQANDSYCQRLAAPLISAFTAANRQEWQQH